MRFGIILTPRSGTEWTRAVVDAEQRGYDTLPGRFELGIGTGRPDAEHEAESLGMPWGSAAERREHLLATVAAVRARVDPAPPVVVAATLLPGDPGPPWAPSNPTARATGSTN
ncbi:hypothetical protein [Nocardia neocaledoniensis]|uniref:hypothetical protein n=1 Tax=Nocardia neocaledoniensis TaxID=236511 RepID=UPI00245457AB|nr:hypothetical protein [Nocardia neocaledoniensis]